MSVILIAPPKNLPRGAAPGTSCRWRSFAWLCLALCACVPATAGCGGCGESKWNLPSADVANKIHEKEGKEATAEEAAAAAAKKQSAEQREAATKAAADKKEAAKKEAAAKAAKAQAATQASDPEGLQPAAAPPLGEQPQAPPAGPQPPQAAPPSIVLLPEDVSAWKDQDYQTALARQDPRLLAALRQRAEQTAGQEREAVLFASLLAPQAPGKAAHATARGRGGTAGQTAFSAALVSAVAEALAISGTAPARATLEQVLAGNIKTAADNTAAEVVLKSLLQHPAAENEDLVFRALTEFATPSGQESAVAGVPPALGSVQQKALALVKPAASSRLRVKIAQLLTDPATPAGLRSFLAPVVKDAIAQNLEAHLVIFQSELTDAATRTAIEKSFLTQSFDALGCALGIPEKLRAAAANPVLPFVAARQLCGADFAAFLDSRQQSADSLQQAAGLIVLSATIPSDAARSRLHRTLERHWEEGPTALRSAGLGGGVMGELGVLVVLKSLLPRTSPASALLKLPANQSSTAAVAPARGTAAKRAPSGKPTKSQDTAGKAREQKEKADESWRKLSEDMLRWYCKQFRAVSLARNDAARKEGRSPEAVDAWTGGSQQPCFATPPVAAYRLDWPGPAGAQLAGVSPDPLQISYVRFEEKTRPAHVVGYYRRLLKGCQQRTTESAVWLDGLLAGSAPGRSRSVDLLLSRPQGGLPQSADEEQGLIVDILSVETNALREAKP
jgi:hypothetical protein